MKVTTPEEKSTGLEHFEMILIKFEEILQKMPPDLEVYSIDIPYKANSRVKYEIAKLYRNAGWNTVHVTNSDEEMGTNLYLKQ